MDCILRTTPEFVKANTGSAGVLLGLTPTLLSLLGPTTAQTAALSIERPFLSSLITIGAPAVSPVQLFDNPRIDHVFHFWTSPATRRLHLAFTTPGAKGQPFGQAAHLYRSLFAALKNLMALLAVANTMHNSLNLDLRTVVSWRCNTSFLPFMWNMIIITVTWSSAISLFCRMRAARLNDRQAQNKRDNDILEGGTGHQPEYRMGLWRPRLSLAEARTGPMHFPIGRDLVPSG